MRFCIWVSDELEPDFVTSLIRYWTKADFSHIGIGIFDEDPMKPHTMYHAYGPGFSKDKVEEFLAKGKVFRGAKEISVTDVQAALNFLEQKVKDKWEYSESQYIGFGIPLLQWFVDNDDKKVVCSEAVAIFCLLFMVGGDELFENLNLDFQNPKQVWKILNR